MHRSWLARLLAGSASNAGHNGHCDQSQLLSRLLSGLLKCCDPEASTWLPHWHLTSKQLLALTRVCEEAEAKPPACNPKLPKVLLQSALIFMWPRSLLACCH